MANFVSPPTSVAVAAIAPSSVIMTTQPHNNNNNSSKSDPLVSLQHMVHPRIVAATAASALPPMPPPQKTIVSKSVASAQPSPTAPVVLRAMPLQSMALVDDCMIVDEPQANRKLRGIASGKADCNQRFFQPPLPQRRRFPPRRRQPRPPFRLPKFCIAQTATTSRFDIFFSAKCTRRRHRHRNSRRRRSRSRRRARCRDLRRSPRP